MQTIKILKILWKVIKIVILAVLILPFAALILFVLFIAFLFSPLNTGFSYIENQDLIKFKSLTNANGETLLIYRKKKTFLIMQRKNTDLHLLHAFYKGG